MAAVLEENDTSVASGRPMEAIAAGKGRKPKPFMLQGGKGAGRCRLGQPQRPRGARNARRVFETRKKRRPSLAGDASGFYRPAALRDAGSPSFGDGWIHEIKFDGYRIQLRVQDGKVTLKTRKGLDWTTKYPAIARAAGSLPDAIIDGEICALDENGAPDFAALQAALSEGKTDALVYFAFDLLFEGGEDLRTLPLTDRKERLQHLLSEAGEDARVRFVEHFEDGGEAVLRSACRLSLEGIVSKRAMRPTCRAGRTRG